MRAVLTSLKWRLERHKRTYVKFVHLLDSLVVLHSLSRGRSSSRKLRRTILRINSLLLATRSQAVWAYVHTKQNPADAPSRRPLNRKWFACQNGVSLLSVGERDCTPCRRPPGRAKNSRVLPQDRPPTIKISCVLQCFLAVPIFRIFWLNMDQHGPT
jgi:hypothetical protein